MGDVAELQAMTTPGERKRSARAEDSTISEPKSTSSATKKQQVVVSAEPAISTEDAARATSEQHPNIEVESLSEAEIEAVRNSGAIEGDEEFLWDILETTQQSVESKMKAIELAVRNREWTAASKLCHTIKGSTAMLGLTKLRDATIETENTLKALVGSSTMDERATRAIRELRRQVERILFTKRTPPSS